MWEEEEVRGKKKKKKRKGVGRGEGVGNEEKKNNAEGNDVVIQSFLSKSLQRSL